MRILFISQWFDPEPTLKGVYFAQELARKGHTVQVITGYPNYPTGIVYPGYRIRGFMRETMDGISVLRVPLYPSHNQSKIQRILNYSSFAFFATLAGIFTRFKPDVIYVYHPPMTAGAAGALVSFFRRTPFICDIQDLWPDTLKATGMLNNERILAWIGCLCSWVYRRATILITQSPGFLNRMRERNVPEAKLRLVYNWCDEQALSNRALTRPGVESTMAGKFNVVFAGNLGLAQGLGTILDAAELLAASHPDIQLLLVGEGAAAESLKQQASARRIPNIAFVPHMPITEIGQVLARADALLVHLRRDPLFSITIPSKTQAYLFAGRPILMGVEGDAAALVSKAQAGIHFTPEDPRSLADAVLQLHAMTPEERTAMGERGRAFYNAQLSFEISVDMTDQILQSLVAQPG